MESIKCKELTFTYPTSEYPAIKEASFSVSAGELCLLIGESASGKSTLLKLLKKELSPAGTMTGEIDIAGTVGYVSQNVEESIVCDRVRAELSFGLTNMGVAGDIIDLMVAEVASYFNLSDKLDKDVSTLSGGEKQIVNLAAVMIMKPSILLLDEPTSQLDPVSAIRFNEMIAKLHRDFGTTIIMSEHNIDSLIDIADSILLLQNGNLAIKDTVPNVVRYMSDNSLDIADIIPVRMRLFDGLVSVADCKNAVKNIALNDLHKSDINTDVAINVKRISFAYDRGADVLSDLSLNVYSGKINAVLGPNSSGKSTLLKVIAGVKKNYRGKVKCSARVSMLCQNVYDLFTKERCCDEVEFGEITDMLGIDYIASQHPYDLSGGEAQRLAIAKVLQTDADIILFDEPTKGFDPVLKKKLADIMHSLCKMGKTILLVSHDVEFVGEYADYCSFLSRGRIIATADRKAFFSSLSFYTTQIAQITDGKCVSYQDFVDAGGLV